MADKTTTSLTAGTTPLVGTELVYGVQGGNSRKFTASEVAQSPHTQAWGTISGTPTTLGGYGITDAQPLNSDLTAIAALTTTGYGRAFLALADEAAFKAYVNLEIGVDVQAQGATLTSLEGLSLVSGDILYATGGDTLQRLPKGADGQVLNLTAGIPAWSTVSGTGDMVEAIYDPTGIAADAFARANHTGVQAISTVTGLQTALDAKLAIASNLSDLSDAAQARENLIVPTYVADRTALKALDTTKDVLAHLMEGGRSGLFQWTTGDLSAFVTADTDEGVYVKATAIAATSGAWVRQRTNLRVYPEWFGAAHDGTTNDQAAFQKCADMAVAFGWDIGLSSGSYRLTSTVTISYAAHTLTLNDENKTVNLIGEGSGNTQILHSGFVGPAFDYQGKIVSAGVTAKQCFQGFAISAETLGLGTGFKIDNMAYATFIDVATFGLLLHIDATDILTTSFHGCINLYGIRGYKFQYSDFSRPNAISFHGCSNAGHNENIIEVIGGTAITMFGGTLEGFGGSGSDPNRAALLLTNPGVEGGIAVLLSGVHIEANHGLADIFVNHSGTDPVNIVLDGCNIQRGSSVKTTYNLLVQQNTAATGKVTVVARSSFRHFAGYTPVAGEPAIRFISDAACEYDVDVSGSYFGSTVYQWLEGPKALHARVKLTGATGAVLSASAVDSVTRNSAGLYTINLRNALKGTNPIVSAIGSGVIVIPYVGTITSTTVQVGCVNLAGTATDPTHFSVVIMDA